MYLSRLILNPRTRRVQKELANLYELHRTLMSSFPETLPDNERVLFRVEIDSRTGIPTVLLQSHTRPDWGWLGDPGARDYLLQAPETKAFELSFAPGQSLAFRLLANPTVRRDGKRHALYKEEDLRAWLARKAADGGFRVLGVTLVKEGNVHGRQPCKAEVEGEEDEVRRKARKLTLHAVRFEGTLQVTNPGILWETVQQGVGSGKGLGFGLLSLAPVR